MADQDHTILPLQLMVAVQCLREYLGSSDVPYKHKVHLEKILMAPTKKQLECPTISYDDVLYRHPCDNGNLILCSDKGFPTLGRKKDGTHMLFIPILRHEYMAVCKGKIKWESLRHMIKLCAKQCRFDLDEYYALDDYLETGTASKVWLSYKMQKDIMGRYVRENSCMQRIYVLKMCYIRK